MVVFLIPITNRIWPDLQYHSYKLPDIVCLLFAVQNLCKRSGIFSRMMCATDVFSHHTQHADSKHHHVAEASTIEFEEPETDYAMKMRRRWNPGLTYSS